METLLDVARAEEPDFYPLIGFLLSTGCRKGEVLGLKWADLDFTGTRTAAASSPVTNTSGF